MTSFVYHACDLPGGDGNPSRLRQHLITSGAPFENACKIRNLPGIKKRDRRAPKVYARLILPLPAIVWQEIFGWLVTNTNLVRQSKKVVVIEDGEQELITPPLGESPTDADDNDDIDGLLGGYDSDHENKPTMSISSFQAYKSAAVWYHEKCRIAFKSLEETQSSFDASQETLDAKLNGLVNGYKKIVADKKSRGIMAVTEGKSVITDNGYVAIMEKLGKIGEEKPNGPESEDFKTLCFAKAWLSCNGI